LQDPVILDDLSFSAQPTPEPGSLSLLALGGLAGVIGYRRRRRGSSAGGRG
jgi:PEP-CTERM motif